MAGTTCYSCTLNPKENLDYRLSQEMGTPPTVMEFLIFVALNESCFQIDNNNLLAKIKAEYTNLMWGNNKTMTGKKKEVH